VEKIVSLKGLMKKVKISRSRLYDFLDDDRLQVDYRDDQGRPFWKETTADAIARAWRRQRQTRKPGPGKITFKRLGRKAKGKKIETTPPV